MSNAQSVKDFRRRRKENLIKVLGSKCCLCGYDKCIGALEFHHIDETNKKFQLSSGNCHSLDEDLEEVKKCILVCANCHREIHTTDIYKDVDLWNFQNYNEDFEKQLREENKPKEYFCLKCGKKITKYSKSGLCPNCFSFTQRKANRPERQELKTLIRTLPFTQIGVIYGVSDNSIRKWCDKYNLPRKKKDIEAYTDKQWSKI